MRRRSAPPWLAAPLALWLFALLIVPLAFVIFYAFLSRGPYGELVYTFNLGNFRRAADSLYVQIYWRSLELAALSTLVCVILGYPVAVALATAPKRFRALLFVLLMVPFLTNFIVRVYALRLLLGVEGPLNWALQTLGVLREPLQLTDTPFLVSIGMVTNYLPFMVLPLYVVLEKFDYTLVEAGRDLGASRWQLWRRVLLPLTMPGLVSGIVLVFVPVLGEFTIPDLLGGARTMLLGNLITEQFLKARDWPFGSALAVILVAIMGAAFWLKFKLAPEGELHG